MSDNRLPPDIKSALLQVCRQAYWYKHSLFDMFAHVGISQDLYLNQEHEPKIVIARQLLGALENMGDDGWLLQRRLLTELCKLRDVADNDVPDRDAGLDALRKLKRLAVDQGLVLEQEKQRASKRSSKTNAELQKSQEHEKKLQKLNSEFAKMVSSSDTQARGYDLERLLKELFDTFELPYRPSYRIEGEQIDGSFHYRGFDYIVEARWRKEQPTLEQLLAFKGKVDRKIESTRGLFISMEGFRPEVIQRLKEAPFTNLVLMDGYDLTLILEGRIGLIDGLKAKADKASQEGILFYPLKDTF